MALFHSQSSAALPVFSLVDSSAFASLRPPTAVFRVLATTSIVLHTSPCTAMWVRPKCLFSSLLAPRLVLVSLRRYWVGVDDDFQCADLLFWPVLGINGDALHGVEGRVLPVNDPTKDRILAEHTARDPRKLVPADASLRTRLRMPRLADRVSRATHLAVQMRRFGVRDEELGSGSVDDG